MLDRVARRIADSAPRNNCGDQFLARARGQLWSVTLFRGRQAWHYLSRFRFFLTIFSQLETIDLLYDFVRVNWPNAAAVFDILVDDSLQLFFFNVIKHNSNEPLLKQAAHF